MGKKEFIIMMIVAVVISAGVINFNYNKDGVITSANSTKKQNIKHRSWKERLGIDDAEMEKIMAEGERLGLTEIAKKVILEEEKSRCQYDTFDGKVRIKTVAYIEGEKYRTEFTVDGQRNYLVFDGQTMYSWIIGREAGIKIDLACLEKLKKKGKEIDPFDEVEVETENELLPDIFEEAIGIECRKIDKIDWTIPVNLEFIDQCKFLEEQQNKIKEINNMQN